MGTQVPLSNILFPTDFSKSCEAIADHVAGVASTAHAKVWLLSVVPRLEEWHGVSEVYFGPFSDSAVLALANDRKALETERLKLLQAFQAKYFGSLESAKAADARHESFKELRDPTQSAVDTSAVLRGFVNSEISVASGGVADTIIDFARERNAGMIMMPTRARGRHRQFLLGSITGKVLHDAPCPVWTSPHPRELDPFRPYRRIILALDYRSLSVPLLVRGSEFAELFGASLVVFSAIPRAAESSPQLIQKLRRDLTSTLEKQLEDSKIKASIRLVEGNPGDVIWEVAAEIERADLIITGRGRLHEPSGHVHSHSYEIIWNAPCPVITL
jgi:nucleotide-binding universal stress UspA family protein